MNTQAKRQQPNQPVDASLNPIDSYSDFDSWARAVRPQLLAALRKGTTSLRK